MRILYLTTEFPSPPIGGGPVRTLSQIKVLASFSEVERITLVSVAERDVPAGACDALAATVPKLRVIPPIFHPIHLWKHPRWIPRVVALRARRVPYVVAKWDSRGLRAMVRRELRDCGVDVVYIDHLGMSRYLPEIHAQRPGARVVLEEHNVESDFFRRFAERQNGLARLVADIEWRRAARVEEIVLGAVDAVVAISREDARHFAELTSVPVHVVPLAIEFERQPRPQVGAPHFCYVGTLGWHPNVAGLDWLCTEVWPRIRSRIPGATLEIAGVGLDRDRTGQLIVPEGWKVPGVATVGFVDDVEPLYRRALAVLAPVVGGSGVRIKILEAFRAGLPVVTTSDGACGLGLSDGNEALIASDPAAFAERVVRLVEDESLGARLRDEAYAYLEKHHSAAAARDALRRALGIGRSP